MKMFGRLEFGGAGVGSWYLKLAETHLMSLSKYNVMEVDCVGEKGG